MCDCFVVWYTYILTSLLQQKQIKKWNPTFKTLFGTDIFYKFFGAYLSLFQETKAPYGKFTLQKFKVENLFFAKFILIYTIHYLCIHLDLQRVRYKYHPNTVTADQGLASAFGIHVHVFGSATHSIDPIW